MILLTSYSLLLTPHCYLLLITDPHLPLANRYTTHHFHIFIFSYFHIFIFSRPSPRLRRAQHYYIIILSHYHIITLCYSVLKLFTGFATAARIAWKLIVTTAMTIAAIPARINTHQL